MDWVVDRASKGTKRKKREPVNLKNSLKTTRFDEYMIQQYEKYVKDVETQRQALQRELEEKKKHLALIEPSESRGRWRDKLLLVKRIEEAEKKFEALKTDKLIQEYKALLVPYAQAYEREQQLTHMNQLKAKDVLAEDKKPKNANGLPLLMEQVTMFTREESQVFKDYLEGVEDTAPEVKIMHREICDECDDVMVLDQHTSVLMCPFCSNWKPYLDATSSHMAYGEEVEFSSFAYLRLNHFNERLTYAQAKESNQIPQEIIERVMKWLYENRVSKADEITLEQTYHSMKELKLRAYYKQNTQLWCRITGNPPLRMSPEHEEQLRLMFKAIQRLWPKYKPDNRKNFLSYNYCLYKFNELLGYDEFLPYFKLLKGPKKLQKQDEIYQKMCKDPELKWEFIPSKF